MSIFETSSELFEDSDSASQSTFECKLVLNFIKSKKSFQFTRNFINFQLTAEATSLSSNSADSEILETSFSSEDNSMERRTRRRQMGSIFSQNTTSSSDNQNMNSPSVNTDSDSSSTASDISHVSETETSNNSNRSSQSSDTEPYDYDEEMARAAENNNPVIEINDSQMPNNVQDDDDVILIPQNIETIDLCTQAVSVPLRLQNEVIDITDSPGTEPSYAGPVRRRRNRQPEYVNNNPASASTPQRPTTSTPNTRQRLNLDDSLNDSQPKITLTCPICLDSVVNRTPVSTLCGHIFCQTCIIQALGNAKKCPMCKKALGGKKPFFNIFLPC